MSTGVEYSSDDDGTLVNQALFLTPEKRSQPLGREVRSRAYGEESSYDYESRAGQVLISPTSSPFLDKDLICGTTLPGGDNGEEGSGDDEFLLCKQDLFLSPEKPSFSFGDRERTRPLNDENASSLRITADGEDSPTCASLLSPLPSSTGCDEERCGTRHLGNFDDDGVVAKPSFLRNAGKGLFALRSFKHKEIIGMFGGLLECGDCTRQNHPNRRKTFEVVCLEKEEKDVAGDVFWHLTRTYNDDLDGLCWYANAARKKNPKKYRTPNAYIEADGFDKSGCPLVYLIAVGSSIVNGTELLISY